MWSCDAVEIFRFLGRDPTVVSELNRHVFNLDNRCMWYTSTAYMICQARRMWYAGRIVAIWYDQKLLVCLWIPEGLSCYNSLHSHVTPAPIMVCPRVNHKPASSFRVARDRGQPWHVQEPIWLAWDFRFQTTRCTASGCATDKFI